MKRVEKQKAIKLRLQGRSYNEIKRILNLPSKGTLSYWFKNLALSPQARKRLADNILLAQKRGLLRYNYERTKKIQRENRRFLEESAKAVGSLSRRELFLVGTALYWGEGTKSENNLSSPTVALANSDPYLIALFLQFIREVLGIAEEKIRAGIHIHPNIKVHKAKSYWAQVTGLPKERFYIIRQISSASKFRRPRNSLPFGTVTIKVHSRKQFYKVKGYIEGLRKNIGRLLAQRQSTAFTSQGL